MRMNLPIAEDLYHQLIHINMEAFINELFDVAYQSLSSALQCARHIESDQPLQEIRKLAVEQLAWIDEFHPTHPYSTMSSIEFHGMKSMYAILADQVDLIDQVRKIKTRR